MWLNIGRSAGHSGLSAVDISEGTLFHDFTGRIWNVGVRSAAQERRSKHETKQATDILETQGAIIAHMQSVEGDTTSAIRDKVSTSPKRFTDAFESLIKDGVVMPANITKTNKQTYSGFRPSHSFTRIGHSDTPAPTG